MLRSLISLLFISMAVSPPTVLVLGHSFVRRLRDDLKSNFDPRADGTFKLSNDTRVHMHGVGGRTVRKLRQYDLGVVTSVAPDVVILDIGTNDLSANRPEVVGSEIEDLVCLLLDSYLVRVVAVCEVIPRAQAPVFNEAATVLNQYLRGVLEPFANAFLWEHRGFSNPSVDPYLPDGVHLNSSGQYCLYRSYRGAMLKALPKLYFVPLPL